MDKSSVVKDKTISATNTFQGFGSQWAPKNGNLVAHI